MKETLFTRNLTLLVLGQASSLFGNFILRIALSMAVLEETGSAAVFAGILALSTLPTILLSPLGGILADRMNRKNIMVALDSLTGLSVLLAALLLPRGEVLSVITVLLVVLSVLGAFETPTVQACLPQLLEGERLVRGNAVISQVSAVTYLVAPMVGGVLFAAVGLSPVMLASVLAFFLTAFLECFILLPPLPNHGQGEGAPLFRKDFHAGVHFITKEEPGILKLLLLCALIRFFIIGTILVGLPYLVRSVLLLGAGYYGAAESGLGLSTLVGGAAAGALAGKVKLRSLHLVLAAMGVFLIPAGVVFFLPLDTMVRYFVVVIGFCGIQGAATLFSILAVSHVQSLTPNHLLGKVMAYASAVSLCVQPLGQAFYGLLFDRFSTAPGLVLLPTGLIVMAVGLLSAGFLRRLSERVEPVLPK